MEFTAAATWLNTAFAGFDNAILEFMHTLEEAAGGIITPLAKFITLIGEKGLWMFALAFVLMLFARTRKLGICLFGAVCCGALITNIILKDLVARPRPFEAMAPFLKYWKAVGSPAEDGFSFPSGHVTAAAAGMSAIMFVRGKKWILPSALYVFLMCFSRNYLMAHYPSDVLAASIVGLFSGFVAWLIGSFIWEYIDDNDDLPFFRTLRHFSLPLPSLDGAKKKLNRVPEKAGKKSRRDAKADAPRGRHSAEPSPGRHSASRRAARVEPDFELDQFDEDIDMKLDESFEDEVRQDIQSDSDDAYDTLLRASRRREDTDDHPAVTGRHAAVTGRHAAVTGSHAAVTGRHAAVTGSHAAVTGSHAAVTGRHAAVSEKRPSAKMPKLDFSRAAAGFGGVVSAAKAKMPAVKAPSALKWRAEQTAADKAMEATGRINAAQAEAKARAEAAGASKGRSTSDWNARWEEYQARKEKAQVKTAPAEPGSAQMKFETIFAAGDEDMKIAPAKPAQELSAAAADVSVVENSAGQSAEAPAAVEAAEKPAKEAAEEKLLSPVKVGQTGDEAPAQAASDAVFAPPPVKTEETPVEAKAPEAPAKPASIELDMSEFYSMLDGSYDYSKH